MAGNDDAPSEIASPPRRTPIAATAVRFMNDDRQLLSSADVDRRAVLV